MPSVGTACVVGSIATRARGIQERQRAGGAIRVVVAAVQTFWKIKRRNLKRSESNQF